MLPGMTSTICIDKLQQLPSKQHGLARYPYRRIATRDDGGFYSEGSGEGKVGRLREEPTLFPVLVRASPSYMRLH